MENAYNNIQQIILHPHLLAFIEVKQLGQFSVLCKSFNEFLKSNHVDIGYWYSMCVSLSGQYGLYCPLVCFNPKNYFFDELWTNRVKWNIGNDNQQIFKVRVATRFRPGERNNNKLSLPLHQFLKVRRMQLGKDQQQVFIGEQSPPEYDDALLGTLMQDPVMLPHSKKVIDRSVAVICENVDPFTGSHFTLDMLIPLPDLKEDIEKFRQRRQNCDVSLNVNDAKLLSDTTFVNPKVLETLVALEQLMCAFKRAQYEDMLGISTTTNDNSVSDNNIDINQPEENNDDTLLQNENEISGANNVPSSQVLLPQTLNNEMEDNLQLNKRGFGKNGSNIGSSRWRKNTTESARIIDISKEKSSVVMNVPGTGLKPFYFNHVFPDKDSQLSIYRESAQDLVIASINGVNGCLLCYGQTGSGKVIYL